MVLDGTPRRVGAIAAGFAIAGVTFALVVLFAVASEGDVTLPILWVERVVSRVTGLVRSTGDGLGFGTAFVAGAIAAFNPCGFALLPAYLGLYLGEAGVVTEAGTARRRSVARALWVSFIMSLAFGVVFGVVGAAIALVATAAIGVLPWLGLSAGAALVVGGAAVLSGWHPVTTSGATLADRLGAEAGRRGVRGYAAFGVAYGLASLSCTLPVVFAVVGAGAGSTGAATAALRLVSLAAGVAFVLAAITVVAGVFGTTALRAWRRLGAIVEVAGGVVLLLAGAYTLYYWLTIGRSLLF